MTAKLISATNQKTPLISVSSNLGINYFARVIYYVIYVELHQNCSFYICDMPFSLGQGKHINQK